MSVSRSFSQASFGVAGLVFLFAVFSLGCRQKVVSVETFATSGNLKFIESFPLTIREPSGLCLAMDKKSLWVLSDEKGVINEISLSGKKLRQIRPKLKDTEGIALIDASTLAVVAERSREIVLVDMKGGIKIRKSLNLPGADNSGLEGLDYDPIEKRFYALKEKAPGLLLVLDEEMNELRRQPLNFASDYSGVEFEGQRKHLWILSHEDKNLHVLNLQMEVQAVFLTGIPQQEGFAVDYDARRLYIVCDKTARLYVFEFAAY